MTARIDITKNNVKAKDIKDCEICCTTAEDPRMFDCLHNFCLKCLKSYGKDKSAGDSINCPVCNKAFKIPSGGFDDVPINHFVVKLIKFDNYSKNGKETVENPTKSFCAQCFIVDEKVSAVRYCVDCKEHLCGVCSRKHEKATATNTHKIYTLDEKPQVDELLKVMPNYCQDHPSNPLAFYCSNCETTNCVICITVHKGHNCIDLKTAKAELSEKTYDDVVKWSRYGKETDEFVKSIDSTLKGFGVQVNTARSNTKKRYDEMKSLLKKQYHELIQNLNEIESKRQEELETMRQDGKQEMLILENLERHWNEVKARGSDCDIVQAAINLRKRSEQVTKQHDEQMSKDRINRSKLEFHTVKYEPTDTLSISGGTTIIGTIRENFNVDQRLFPDWNLIVHNSDVQSFKNEISSLYGIAIHNNEVYMASYDTPYILVHSLKKISKVSRQISVQGLTAARGLVYNESDSCLYASNCTKPGHIYKISISDNCVTDWVLPTSQPRGLSISQQKNLLVSYYYAGQIDEFSGAGQLIRSIKLNDGIASFHSIELKSGEFIICQWNPIHRICLVDPSGTVINSYGKEGRLGGEQLYFPKHVELDQKGNILVLDSDNHKLRVLTSDLKYVADVNINDTEFKCPTAICWDKENSRLLITTRSNGLFVITPQAPQCSRNIH